MNRDEFAGKWRQLRGQIKQKWGKLTDDELDVIAGNYDMLVGKIQEKYGQAREQIERELGSFEMMHKAGAEPHPAGAKTHGGGEPRKPG